MMKEKTFKLGKKGGLPMKRVILLLAVCVLLLTATAAQAATKVHGGFQTDSTGCAKCHITHAAEAAKLLLTGSNQTEFCWACHGSFSAVAPYDVKNGAILHGNHFQYEDPMTDWTVANSIYASYTGGFVYTYDFKTLGDTAFSEADIGTAKFKASVSAHNVQTISLTQSPWDTTNKIPGGSAGFAASSKVFTCSSCHDPHGYNSTAAGGGGSLDNPRLLRKDLPARTDIDLRITIDISNDGSGNASAGSLRTTGYPDATINRWCGGCHNLLDVGKNAGSHKDTDSRYRHAMGIAVGTPPADVTLGTGLPLASGNKLTCITCHRVHGTAASMTAVANSWTGQNYDNLAGANVAKSGAALLRLDNRDVCYKCHDAARFNANSTSGSARQAVTY